MSNRVLDEVRGVLRADLLHDAIFMELDGTRADVEELVYLVRRPNRVIEHRPLLAAIWGEYAVEHSEYLRVLIGQLRKKVEPVPSSPSYLITEPWVGYRFNPVRVTRA